LLTRALGIKNLFYG